VKQEADIDWSPRPDDPDASTALAAKVVLGHITVREYVNECGALVTLFVCGDKQVAHAYWTATGLLEVYIETADGGVQSLCTRTDAKEAIQTLQNVGSWLVEVVPFDQRHVPEAKACPICGRNIRCCPCPHDAEAYYSK